MAANQAVIFDLDGVIVSTDHYHFLAWKQIADQENIPFDEAINHRLRGVSRKESLDIILSFSNRQYAESEKSKLMHQKNQVYLTFLESLTPEAVLDGVDGCLSWLKKQGIKTAIGSSSKNARFILEKIHLSQTFDVVIDGNDITNSKPHPEVFLRAAQALKLGPDACIVVEDAISGVEAAKNAGMKVVAVGDAMHSPIADVKTNNVLKALKQLLVSPDFTKGADYEED